jgi:peptide/nickel transport system permease protein
MTSYHIILRLLQGIVIFIIVTIFVFLAMRLLPGDPILIYVVQQDVEFLSPEILAQLRHEYGLDQPLVIQYFDWISGILHGDFGTSIHYREPVGKLLAERLPVSIYLAIPSFLLAGFFGVLAGLVAGLRRGKIIDTMVTSLANFGIAVPHFWLGILMIYFFGLYLGWLPVQGYTSPFDDFWLSINKMIMPVFVVAIGGIAFFARQTRSSILEVTRQDYIRTAWSKGLRERVVVMRHALKNAFIPVITVMGMSLVMMIAGQVIIENVFSIPGLGRLLVSAIFGQDYQVVQACVLVMAVLVVLANLIVDISYTWFDPRIRYG